MRGLGVVGCGLIGRKRAEHAPAAGLEVVRCFDVDAGRARSLVSDLSLPADIVASTASSLVNDPAVELVVVATSHDALAELALLAIEAGKHVLIEKPGAIDAATLEKVRDAAIANGRTVRVGFNHRFHPAFVRLSEVVSTGSHGSMMYVRARCGHGGRLGYEQEWRFDRGRSGGGELVDQGSHLLDLTRALFGELELAFSELRTAFWDADVEDNAFVAVRPRSGGFGWLHASWTEWKNLFSYEVMLERAKLEITGIGGSYGPERLVMHEMQPGLGPPPSTTWEWPPGDKSWRDELIDVLNAIDGRPARGASIDDAIATLSLIGAAYRS